VKTNVFIAEFNDRTFHVVGRIRARTPWKFIDSPLGKRAPQ